jgi:hypothetical protein
LEHFDTALRLAEMLYTLTLNERLGFIKGLIDLARSGVPKLKSILTNPEILYAPMSKKAMFFRRQPDWYMTIAQAADAYCWKFWGASIVDVMRGNAKEPETGEVFEDEDISKASSPSYKGIPKGPYVFLKASSPSCRDIQLARTRVQEVAIKYDDMAMASSGPMRTLCLQMVDRAKAIERDLV